MLVACYCDIKHAPCVSMHIINYDLIKEDKTFFLQSCAYYLYLLQGVGLSGRKRFSRESFSASAQANAGGQNNGNNLGPQFPQSCVSELDVSSKRPRDKRKEIRSKLKLDNWESSTVSSEKTGCRWTFVFDPAGRLCYYWSMVVSLAFLYNFWVLIYRFAFQVSTNITQ